MLFLSPRQSFLKEAPQRGASYLSYIILLGTMEAYFANIDTFSVTVAVALL